VSNVTKKDIERSLTEQLRANGADIEVFRGLIADYMMMFSVCEKLKTDIRKRGTIIEVPNARGTLVAQPNSSIKELRDTNKSMLAILKQLNLSIDTVQPLEDDRL
jgi:predicted methyltransferase MtxX (methanogen marker protein 4)